MTNDIDCDFYYFNQSGKWKYEGEGRFPRQQEKDVLRRIDRHEIIRENGSMPGIITRGESYTILVIPRPNCTIDDAWPRMLFPEVIFDDQ